MGWKKLAVAGGAVAGLYLLVRHQRSTATTAVQASETVVEPTEAQQQNPLFWEGIAREIGDSISGGMGALPPWPAIGPIPRTRLGPVWSATPWSVNWR